MVGLCFSLGVHGIFWLRVLLSVSYLLSSGLSLSLYLSVSLSVTFSVCLFACGKHKALIAYGEL